MLHRKKTTGFKGWEGGEDMGEEMKEGLPIYLEAEWGWVGGRDFHGTYG